MKKCLIVITISILIFHFNNCKGQNDKNGLKWAKVDSNCEAIIFNNYWSFDSIIIDKFFNSEYNKYFDSVIYSFSMTTTYTCYRNEKQEIPSSWFISGCVFLDLTFNVDGGSSRWIVRMVSEDRLVFESVGLKHPNIQHGNHQKFKLKSGKFIIFHRVDDDYCDFLKIPPIYPTENIKIEISYEA